MKEIGRTLQDMGKQGAALERITSRKNAYIRRLKKCGGRRESRELEAFYNEIGGHEKEKEKRYQTTFAKDLGSAAAPTASLHFSKKLL